MTMLDHVGVLSDGTPYRVGSGGRWAACDPVPGKKGRRARDPVRDAAESNLRAALRRLGVTTRDALQRAADAGHAQLTVIGGRVFDADLILEALGACGWDRALPLAVCVGEVESRASAVRGWIVRFERPDGARLAVVATTHPVPSRLEIEP